MCVCVFVFVFMCLCVNVWVGVGVGEGDIFIIVEYMKSGALLTGMLLILCSVLLNSGS